MSSPLSPLLSPIAGEAAPDGRSVLLVDTDARRPGLQREVRYEITPAELIAAIRTQGADVS